MSGQKYSVVDESRWIEGYIVVALSPTFLLSYQFASMKLPEKRNVPNPLGSFKINIFNSIMDTANISFSERFTPATQDLLQDLSCL